MSAKLHFDPDADVARSTHRDEAWNALRGIEGGAGNGGTGPSRVARAKNGIDGRTVPPSMPLMFGRGHMFINLTDHCIVCGRSRRDIVEQQIEVCDG